jgi:MYXO-CTERM domain-containing protein
LVAWNDDRYFDDEVFATRVSMTGVLDPYGIRIRGPAGQPAFSPSLAFGSGTFLVAYTVPVTGAADGQIFVTQLSPAGVLGPSVMLDGVGDNPGAASDGTDFLVAFESSAGIRVRRASGATLQPLGVTVAVSSDTQASGPTSAWGASGYLVVWGRKNGASYEIAGARVAQDGTVIDPGGFIVQAGLGDVLWPAIGWAGTHFVVAWDEGIRTAAVRVIGNTVLDAAPILLGAGTGGPPGMAPGIAFDGTYTSIAWTEAAGNDLHAATLDDAGTLLAPGDVSLDLTWIQDPPATLAYDGSRYLLAWNEPELWRSFEDDIFATTFTPGAPALTRIMPLDTSGDPQRRPAVCSDGNTWLVVWDDRALAARTAEILGVRIDSSGAVLDAPPLVIEATADAFRLEAVCAWTAPNWLVAYNSEQSIRGKLVPPSGQPSAAPFEISSNGRLPAIASDGAQFMVTWQTYSSSAVLNPSTIRAARVSNMGAVLDPSGIDVCTAGPVTEATIAFGQGQFLVGWNSNDDIYARRVTADGGVLDSATGFAVSAGLPAHRHPRVAFDGQRFVIAWSESLTGSPALVHGARVDNGMVLDPQGVALTSGSEDHVFLTLANDPAGVLLVWGGAAVRQLWAERLSSLDAGSPFLVAGASDDTAEPAAAAAASGVLIAYSSYDAGLGAYRVMTRLVGDGNPDGGVDAGSGSSDGGTDGGLQLPDAGPGLRTLSVGCGCGTGSGPSAAISLIILLVIWSARRRVSDGALGGKALQ